MTLVKTGFPRLCHDRSKARSHHSWICQTSWWRCPELIDALWILQSIRKIPGENKFSMWLALWFKKKKTILRNHLKGELDGTKLRSHRFQFPDMITSMHQVSQQLYIAYIEWLWIFQRHGNCAWWTVGFAHMPPFWALSCIGLFLSFVWRSYSSYIVQNVFANAPRFKEFLHAVKIQFIFCFIIFFLLRRYWDPWICVMNNIGSIHPTQNIPVINTF